jgi:hypothetical protein
MYGKQDWLGCRSKAWVAEDLLAERQAARSAMMTDLTTCSQSQFGQHHYLGTGCAAHVKAAVVLSVAVR